MARKNLVRLLFELSQDAALRKRFRAEADAVMTEHRLSAAEKQLLRDGDARRVSAYLGAAWPMGPTIVKTTGMGPTIVKSAAVSKRKPTKR